MIPDNEDAQELLRALRPNPDWQVTVQKPQTLRGSTSSPDSNGPVRIAPGYVQIDDLSNGNQWSKSPATLRDEGFVVPDFSTLPQGCYLFDEACVLVQLQLGKWPELPALNQITTELVNV